jgi:hypothetical protein
MSGRSARKRVGLCRTPTCAGPVCWPQVKLTPAGSSGQQEDWIAALSAPIAKPPALPGNIYWLIVDTAPARYKSRAVHCCGPGQRADKYGRARRGK